MPRYIDADALKELWTIASPEPYNTDAAEVLYSIDNAPTADVAVVVHAYWDDKGRYRFKDGSIAVRCSNCGCSITEKEYQKFVWNGCPVCLAKMDGERRNDVE